MGTLRARTQLRRTDFGERNSCQRGTCAAKPAELLRRQRLAGTPYKHANHHSPRLYVQDSANARNQLPPTAIHVAALGECVHWRQLAQGVRLRPFTRLPLPELWRQQSAHSVASASTENCRGAGKNTLHRTKNIIICWSETYKRSAKVLLSARKTRVFAR